MKRNDLYAGLDVQTLWEEFTVEIMTPYGVVPMCGLCGGGGMVDTRGHAPSPGGGIVGARDCGIRAPCICPNGRYRKFAGEWE